MIELTPTNTHPVPFDTSDELPKTQADAVAIAINTADLLASLGGDMALTPDDFDAAKNLITKSASGPQHVTSPAVARAASDILKRFDYQAMENAQQARNFITNRLIELADCGDLKIEIKALELLGKHSDVGIFTERSEVTITHTSSKSLEDSIKERIKRMLHSDVTDIAPIDDLDTHLGVIEAIKPPEPDQNLEPEAPDGA